jgi:hypothetical protein
VDEVNKKTELEEAMDKAIEAEAAEREVLSEETEATDLEIVPEEEPEAPPVEVVRMLPLGNMLLCERCYKEEKPDPGKKIIEPDSIEKQHVGVVLLGIGPLVPNKWGLEVGKRYLVANHVTLPIDNTHLLVEYRDLLVAIVPVH